MVQLALNFMRNSNLLSNHYLEALIQQTPEWKEGKATAEALGLIKPIYEKGGG